MRVQALHFRPALIRLLVWIRRGSQSAQPRRVWWRVGHLGSPACAVRGIWRGEWGHPRGSSGIQSQGRKWTGVEAVGAVSLQVPRLTGQKNKQRVALRDPHHPQRADGRLSTHVGVQVFSTYTFSVTSLQRAFGFSLKWHLKKGATHASQKGIRSPPKLQGWHLPTASKEAPLEKSVSRVVTSVFNSGILLCKPTSRGGRLVLKSRVVKCRENHGPNKESGSRLLGVSFRAIRLSGWGGGRLKQGEAWLNPGKPFGPAKISSLFSCPFKACCFLVVCSRGPKSEPCFSAPKVKQRRKHVPINW